MATDKDQKPETDEKSQDMSKETTIGAVETRPAARLTLGQSLRTRLLITSLGLVIIAMLAGGYLGVNSVQSMGRRTQQVSGEALRAQAEEYLSQLTIGEAQHNDLILQRVQRDAENVAQYTTDIFENAQAFSGGNYWNAEAGIVVESDGQYMNHDTDVSDVFVPNFVEMDTELQTALEMSAYLDFILVPTFDSDPNTVAIYLGTEQEITRYYPNIRLGTLVPPDFQVTQRPWYTDAAPNNNPERQVVWSPVYTDATGRGMLVTAAAPIYTSQDRFVGVIGIDATLQDISANVENARLLGEGYSFLIDDTGRAIALPKRGYLDVLGRPAEGDEVGTDLSEITTPFAPILTKMMFGEAGFYTLLVGEKELFVAYAPLESVGWGLANVVEADQVLRAMGTLQNELERETQSLVLARILPVGVGILVLVTILGLVLTGRLVRPIRSLATAAQQIGAGRWDTSLPPAGNDEIGVLSRSFAAMTVQLRGLMAGLERRVIERTRGLQAATDVAHATTSVLDPDTLLRQVVGLVRERFDLYYVGLFLLEEESDDSDHTFAVLRAGTGEAGQEMLDRGHRLEMGGESMIGQCVARSEARVALDVGEEAVRFDNPFLPDTRSELALPLRSRGQVIGAMTVQSTEPSAFDEAYIAILQTMADQVAIAIDNARLFADTQVALGEMETIHQQYLGRAWASHAADRKISGYEQVGTEMMPLRQESLPQVPLAAMEQRPLVWRDEEQSEGDPPPSTLVVPIVLRGQSIGALGFKEDGNRQWSTDDVVMAETIAEQLALAADNLRLLDETQRRAAREQLIGELSEQMQRATDIEDLMRIAAEELNRTLDGSRAFVHMGTAAELTGKDGDNGSKPAPDEERFV
ncbi:MAG: GAF domain-containing protein [Chloroflexi bacterium]|nr:GAF domain-containing protein [Chloroflexota bacterium]